METSIIKAPHSGRNQSKVDPHRGLVVLLVSYVINDSHLLSGLLCDSVLSLITEIKHYASQNCTLLTEFLASYQILIDLKLLWNFVLISFRFLEILYDLVFGIYLNSKQNKLMFNLYCGMQLVSKTTACISKQVVTDNERKGKSRTEFAQKYSDIHVVSVIIHSQTCYLLQANPIYQET